MAASLQEYLIGLGFKVDGPGFKRFSESVDATAKSVAGLGEKAVATSLAIGLAVEKIASRYEDLYYVSQRTGATVTSIQAAGYGFSQIGLTAGDAKSAIESLAMTMRSNPGTGALLNTLGIRTQGRDSLSIAMDLVGQLKKMPFYLASQYGSMVGIDPHTLLMLEMGFDDLTRTQADHIARQKEAGVSADDLGDKSHKFMVALRELEDEFVVIGDAMISHFVTPATHAIEILIEFERWIARTDKASGGLLTTLLAIGGALGGLAAVKAILGRFFGGAAATAAGTAAGGAAAPAVAAGSMFRGSSVGLGIAGLGLMKDDAATGNELRSLLRWFIGIEDPGEPAPWAKGGAWHGGGGVSRKGASAGGGDPASRAERIAFIRAQAIKEGIDPNVAEAFARGEGANALGESRSTAGGANDGGTSGGDFQLHYAPDGRAMGDQFTRMTGRDARDPANWKEADAFALHYAATSGRGWDDWLNTQHKLGVGKFTGIGRPPEPYIATAPLGSDTASSKGDVNIDQTTHITVLPGADAKATSDRVLDKQAGVNADLVRNAGATVR